MQLLPMFAALGLATIHFFANRLRFLEKTPRCRWLSVGGGISVTYVFLKLLPELGKGHEAVQNAVEAQHFLDNFIYLVALAGLFIFFGLERAAKMSRTQQQTENKKGIGNTEIFWLHIAFFATYNLLIGYLLLKNAKSLKDLAFFFIAMALHFIVNDFGLREHYKHRYMSAGRWVLVVAVLIGWGVGASIEIPEFVTGLLLAFLTGGIILNVLKEELPEERESNFTAFLVGGISYALLLLTF